jgi:hypothetical protein
MKYSDISARVPFAVFLQPPWPDSREEANAFHVFPFRAGSRAEPRLAPATCATVCGAGQKPQLKLPMLDLVNTSGGPSSTVPSAPTVNVPSLPAENDWPAALVIFLEARFTAA